MKLVVNAFVTLDMVMQAGGGPNEDRDGGFEYGGWQFPYGDEQLGEVVQEDWERSTAFLLGRKTYDIFAAYWPTTASAPEMADLLNSTPKYVVSRTLRDPGWRNTAVLSGPEAVAQLKAKPGGQLSVAGSAQLLQSLHPLVDEYRLWIYPVHLGTGKRLFAEGSPASAVELVESKTNSKGAIYAVYRPTGEPETGQLGN